MSGPAKGPGRGGPARGWAWPPAEPGNVLALVTGARSQRVVDPLAAELVGEVLGDDGTSYLAEPKYAPALRAWARAEARVLLLVAALERRGLEDDEGNPSSWLAAVERSEAAAERARGRLGLDPLSRSKITAATASATRDGMAALLTHGRALRDAAAERGDVLPEPLRSPLPLDAGQPGPHRGGDVSVVDDALAVLAGLVLESGHRWGEVATPEQWADARAVLDTNGPRRHLLLRSRGRSKTTDEAGASLAAMLTQLAPGAESYAAAGDREQAGLLLRKVRGLVERTPEVRSLVEVGSWRVAVPGRAVSLDVLSADAASSWGLTPSWLVVDELCQWPETANAKSFWESLITSLPKTADSRAVVMSTPGSPAHWSKAVHDSALTDRRWRVSHLRGPAPWTDPADIAAERRTLPDATFQRLYLAEWTEGEDRLVREADLDAALARDGALAPQPGVAYVITLDVGLVNDRTVVAVGHAEGPPNDRRVVVDLLRVWAGTHRKPVDLTADVEETLVPLSAAYNHAPVTSDPYQAAQLISRLTRRGVRATPWQFTAASVGRLGAALHVALRERRLVLPKDAALREELAHVSLREVPGGYRLDHTHGRHDDMAVAVALLVVLLTEQAGGVAGVSVPSGSIRTGFVPPSSLADQLAAITGTPYQDPRDYFPGKTPARIGRIGS